MIYLTSTTDDRLRELRAIAAELRLEREMHSATSTPVGFRFRLGSALVAAGTALASGAPAGHRGTAQRFATR